MAVEDSDAVDFIGIQPASDQVVLTVSDHLPWDDLREHLRVLQTKLNTYLAFIESGELLVAYPGATGRVVGVEVVFRVPPTDEATTFLDRVRSVLADSGVSFSWRQLEPRQSP